MEPTHTKKQTSIYMRTCAGHQGSVPENLCRSSRRHRRRHCSATVRCSDGASQTTLL